MCVSNKVETKSISLQLINVRDSIHESNGKAIVEQRIKKKKKKKEKNRSYSIVSLLLVV